MNKLEQIKEKYRSIIAETTHKISKEKTKIYRISSIRVVLFIAGIAGIIYFWSSGWQILLAVAAVTFIPFFLLVKHHNKLFYKKDYLEVKKLINEQELQALDYDTSTFEAGEEFIDSAHLYTFDLDVFGARSLFQSINRTSTGIGKQKLASWLNAHLEDKAEIEARQEAVRELSSELRFRQRFRTNGLLHKGEQADAKEIIEWADTPLYFRDKPFLKILPHIVLLANVAGIALAAFNVITFSVWGTLLVVFGFLSMAFSGKITKAQTLYGKKLHILATYAKQIQLIEEQDMRASELTDIQQLLKSNSQTAYHAVNRLNELMHSLDQRNNIFVAFILNGLSFWELRRMMKIEAWKEEFADQLPGWLEAIARMDAYCSLATFAYNHPDFVYPSIGQEPFILQAEGLGHPLMRADVCVCNDIDMQQRPSFIIVTGANMAGKSTYLRTVGVNYLLACIGVPVFADEMKIYPAKLITSLRTSDSLNDNESYFFAELKRLKLIIDKLSVGEELFIILDEILKGTNSKDKQKGSIALVSQFMTMNTNGIIATHDLLLGKLTETFPDYIRNFCFEADITNNELTFSYKMRKGVAQNMNACFLMKKMGIAVADER